MSKGRTWVQNQTLKQNHTLSTTYGTSPTTVSPVTGDALHCLFLNMCIYLIFYVLCVWNLTVNSLNKRTCLANYVQQHLFQETSVNTN